jgi:flavin reductase (DIM6/NTAB) family NADH-FMN oxidoreductase RutF
MFYATDERDRTKLPNDPFKAIVAPRPIGWISTRALDGRVNLAPYSFFNGFSSLPPIVGFSSEGWKDSASFAKESGEFVANLATLDLRGPMKRNLRPVRSRRQRIRPRRTDHGGMPPRRGAAHRRKPGRLGVQGG